MAIDEVTDGERADFYGGGEIIDSFEQELADLLGHEAAVFMPSGTMAQQIALRIWSDDRDSKQFAMHASSHLELHEEGAYRELHGLQSQLLGDMNQLFGIEDLKSLRLPVSSVLWELPQREIGGQLPGWEALNEQVRWAKQEGIRRHLDGARLWEAAPHYGKSLSEIAGLFDSAYVSFYKGIGGIAGAVLAGSSDFISQSRVWLRRHGGNLISLHPYVLSARAGMRQHLHAFADYRQRAQDIAARLSGIEGIRIVPAVPCTLMMHLHIAVDADTLNAANRTLAADTQVMLFKRASIRDADTSKVEVSIGAACASLSDEEIEGLFRRLLEACR
jgi:threonine aldolase